MATNLSTLATGSKRVLLFVSRKLRIISWSIVTLLLELGKIIGGWLLDIQSALAAKAGWQMVCKLVLLSGGIAMGLITFATLKLQINGYQRDALEHSFSQFVTDLNNPSPDVRIGALARFPEIMNREVPTIPSQTASSLLKELTPFSNRMERRYATDVQRHIRNFLSGTTRTSEINANRDVGVGPDELKALLAGLARSGHEGWYGGKANMARAQLAIPFNRSRDDNQSWTWIWSPPESIPSGLSAICLFQGSTLNQPSFRTLELQRAVFSEATLKEADFSYCTMDVAKFDRSRLIGTSFEHMNGSSMNFSNAILEHTKFTGARIRGANFSSAKIVHGFFIDADITDSNFTRAQAPMSEWSNAHAGDYFLIQVTAENMIRHPTTLSLPNGRVNATLEDGQSCQLERLTWNAAKLSGIPDLTLGKTFWISIKSGVKFLRGSARTKFYAADLAGADFSSAQMLLCDLDECNFQSGILRKTVFAHCRAHKTDFSKADFTGAVLDDSEFVEATFTGAHLEGLASCKRATFKRCQNLSEVHIKQLESKGATIELLNNLPFTQ
jgi:uncharacterized protein YjbI with pentapeptide repeats